MTSSAIAVVFCAVLGQAAAPTTKPVLNTDDYGWRLSAGDDSAILWWCESARKVSRTRKPPTESGQGLVIRAAKREFEAVQLVVNPTRELRGLTVRATDLNGPGGATIGGEQISLLRVAYVPVTQPTDAYGQTGDWPDPLPPWTAPVNVPANVNQPVWVLVHIPDAPSGDYKGEIRLTADSWSATVPLRVHVWDFTLPSTPRTHSALGLNIGTACRYQAANTPEQQRALLDLYLKSFADHRISPYNPVPFDPMQIKFVPEASPPRAEVGFEAFDAAMQRAINDYRITSFILPLPGLGGGTFADRDEGGIAGHKLGSPQFEAMFSSMVKQIESHLKSKGWLDKAYVYWFDEPQPRDYEFVIPRMDLIRKHAPGLRRMLTEEPTEALFGKVDLWCPLTSHLKPEALEARRAAGEQFWWYICCGPTAPYCTEFIDHPATSLRAWLWQTWQRRIGGILIWETLWWTSPTAFPDSLQNPYADPMSYRTGYGTPVGTRANWGNGDGRFLYPPESAAGGASEFVLAPPVSSLRWEMLRDGVEDLDYAFLLRDAINSAQGKDPQLIARARQLLEVPAEITSGMTQYTYDAAPLERHRRQIAEAIEKLGR